MFMNWFVITSVRERMIIVYCHNTGKNDIAISEVFELSNKHTFLLIQRIHHLWLLTTQTIRQLWLVFGSIGFNLSLCWFKNGKIGLSKF